MVCNMLECNKEMSGLQNTEEIQLPVAADGLSPASASSASDGFLGKRFIRAYLCGLNYPKGKLKALSVLDLETWEPEIGPELLLSVDMESEQFVGYRLPRCLSKRSKENFHFFGDFSNLEVVVRFPLQLAAARRVVNKKVQDRPLVALALPSMDAVPETSRPKEFETRPRKQEGIWLFECDCEDGLKTLLDRLQTAGCSMSDLEERYDVGRLLGAGSFAKVFLAEDRWTGETVAAKVCRNVGDDDKGVALLKEAHALRRARHPTILKYAGLFRNIDSTGQDSWVIITEFVGGGELFEKVRSGGPLSEERSAFVVLQLLYALKSLHQHGFVHRDIKTENVILTDPDSDIVKLVDFGLATAISDREAMTARCGSPGYIAPEVLRQKAYDSKVDCFSVGVLLHILLLGVGPFRGKSLQEMLARNMQCIFSRKRLHSLSAGAQSLVFGLLEDNPATRLSAAEAVTHSWFDSFDICKDLQAKDGLLESSDVPKSVTPSCFAAALSCTDAAGAATMSASAFFTSSLFVEGGHDFAPDRGRSSKLFSPPASFAQRVSSVRHSIPMETAEECSVTAEPADIELLTELPANRRHGRRQLTATISQALPRPETPVYAELPRTETPVYADMQDALAALRSAGICPLSKEPQANGIATCDSPRHSTWSKHSSHGAANCSADRGERRITDRITDRITERLTGRISEFFVRAESRGTLFSSGGCDLFEDSYGSAISPRLREVATSDVCAAASASPSSRSDRSSTLSHKVPDILVDDVLRRKRPVPSGRSNVAAGSHPIHKSFSSGSSSSTTSAVGSAVMAIKAKRSATKPEAPTPRCIRPVSTRKTYVADGAASQPFLELIGSSGEDRATERSQDSLEIQRPSNPRVKEQREGSSSSVAHGKQRPGRSYDLAEARTDTLA